MRKLAWFAVFFAAAALFVLWFPAERRYAAWIPAACAVSGCFLLRRKQGPVFPVLRTALLAFAVGCVYVLLWQAAAEHEINALVGHEQTVEATVLEDSGTASYGLRTDMRIGHLRCSVFTDGRLPLEAGQRIRLRAVFQRTLDKTESDMYLTMGIPVFGYAKGTPEVLGEAEAAWRFLPAKVGRELRNRIRQLFGRDSAGFLLAVLTGDRSELRRDICFSSMLRASGMSHCVAVSGMHVSFLVMFFYLLFGRGRLSAFVCIPVTLLFMAMTGFTASVVRAGVMQLAVCGAKLFRREYDSISALGLALLLLLCLNPYSIRNAGLLLSFASTLGILLFSSSIQKALPGPPERWGKHSIPTRLWYGIRATLSLSLASSVMTVPLQALFYRQICILAPLTNLLALWAVSLCFSLGLAGIFLSYISLPAGVFLHWPVDWLVGYIRWTTGWIGRFPLASLYIRSSYLPVWLAVTWLCMALYRFLPDLEHRLLSFALSALFGLVVFLGLSYVEPALDSFRFCALDVGQGQCLSLIGPETVVLIDCGGSLSANAGDLAAEHLFSQGRFRVDNLFLTHFHQDHVNGVTQLLQRMPVQRLYCPRPEPEDTDAAALLSLAKEKGTKVAFVEDTIADLKYPDMELIIVPPLDLGEENEAGLCIAVRSGEASLLCTGDAGTSTELRLLEWLKLENLTLLVAGHHGSAGSVSDALLTAVKPKAVVISVGRNSYGLPAESTLNRLQSYGAMIYRTDQYGDVTLRCRSEGAIWGK